MCDQCTQQCAGSEHLETSKTSKEQPVCKVLGEQMGSSCVKGTWQHESGVETPQGAPHPLEADEWAPSGGLCVYSGADVREGD